MRRPTPHDATYEGDEATCDGSTPTALRSPMTPELTLLDGTAVLGVGVVCGTGECASGIAVCADDTSASPAPPRCWPTRRPATPWMTTVWLVDADDPDLVALCDKQQGGAWLDGPVALCVDGSWGAVMRPAFGWSTDYDPAGEACPTPITTWVRSTRAAPRERRHHLRLLDGDTPPMASRMASRGRPRYR